MISREEGVLDVSIDTWRRLKLVPSLRWQPPEVGSEA